MQEIDRIWCASNRGNIRIQWSRVLSQELNETCLVNDEPVLEAVLVESCDCSQAGWPCTHH